MTAVSRDYGQLTVTWRTPSGAWDRLRLTRDSSGFTPRADMGTTLIDSLKAGAPTSYTDLAGLSQGKFYYYTVWVRATIDQQWRRAGDVIGLVTQDWGYSTRMFQLIPGVYRDRDMDTASYQLHDKGDLERFLTIPGFEADHVRTELESLKWMNDPDKVSGGLLPLMAKQLGFGYEGELGMRLARQQMRNAVYIYKHKGTQLGIEALVSVLTGWAPTVTVGKNLVLDQNDSSWEEGLGQWVNVSNATLARRSTTDASAPGQIAGPVSSPPGASTGDIGSGSWWLMLTAVAGGDMIIQGYASGTSYDNRTKSIPVTGGTQYTLSIYSQALDTVASVALGVEWFDITGVSLGAVTWGTATANLTSGNTRHTYTVTAPATARFLRVSQRVNGAGAGNRHVLDALQVEAGAAATAYQSARSVRVSFAADRVNLVPNAGAEVNVAGWTATNATIAQETTVIRSGARSFRLTATATGDATFATTAGTGGMPVTPLRNYTASIYIRKDTGTVRSFRVTLVWYSAAGAEILVNSQATVPQVLGQWTRAYVTALAPATAAFAALRLTIYAMGAGENQFVDDALLEDSATLGEFFDGATFSNEGEYLWQSGGSPGNTPSHYYARRLIKNYRLNVRLREFLPAGSTYALLYAGQT
jgi:phage tail-like protein